MNCDIGEAKTGAGSGDGTASTGTGLFDGWLVTPPSDCTATTISPALRVRPSGTQRLPLITAGVAADRGAADPQLDIGSGERAGDQHFVAGGDDRTVDDGGKR